MFTPARLLPALLALSLALVGITACGGASSTPVSGDVIARVGDMTITKADLNHWMATLAGGDFNEVSHNHKVPAGLVSDPANYPACLASLQAAAAKAPKQPSKASKSPVDTPARLLKICHQLYVAIRLQTLNYLITADWTIGAYAEGGIKASNQEVLRFFNEIKKQQFPSQAAFQEYLELNNRTLADELFVVHLDLLSSKLTSSNGGKALLAKLTEAGRRWTAKTDCSPGNVVQHCKQFTHEPPPTTPPPSILMEQVATVTGIPCVNVQACG